MLNENKIEKDLEPLTIYPKLQRLELGNNRIAKSEVFTPLVFSLISTIKKKLLKELKTLVLEGCPLTENENYRKEIFTILPMLEAIDGLDKDDNVISEGESENENSEAEEKPGSVVEIEDSEENESEEGEEEKPKKAQNNTPQFKQPAQPLYGDSQYMQNQPFLQNPSSFPSSYPQSFPMGTPNFDPNFSVDPMYSGMGFENEGLSPLKKSFFEHEDPIGGEEQEQNYANKNFGSDSENEGIFIGIKNI